MLALTPKGREMMVRAVVDGGLTKADAARQFNTTPKTVGKWVERFRKPKASKACATARRALIHRQPNSARHCATPSRFCVGSATRASRSPPRSASRRQPSVASSGGSASTGSSALEPAEPVRRYERDKPGELIHIDIKKLGKFNRIGHRITGDRTGQSNTRGVGWEYVHVCIDDHSRIAFVDIMPDQKKRLACAFLNAAVAYYASLGVTIERVMTDNGSCYQSFATPRCKRLGLKHLRTKPYTPKTNGKAERFVQTSLREWAYARAYNTSDERAASCPSGSTATTGIGRMAV